MKFQFENGEVVVTNDQMIISLLRADKRYKEVVEVKEAPKSKSKKNGVVKEEPLQ